MIRERKFKEPYFREHSLEKTYQLLKKHISFCEKRIIKDKYFNSYVGAVVSPCFPGAMGKGKGLNMQEVIISSFCEAVERSFIYSFRKYKKPLDIILQKELAPSFEKNLSKYILNIDERAKVPVLEFNSTKGSKISLPVQFVARYRRSTGNAVGFSAEEAEYHAIFEIIERAYIKNILCLKIEKSSLEFLPSSEALSFLKEMNIDYLLSHFKYGEDYLIRIEKFSNIYIVTLAFKLFFDSQYFYLSVGVSPFISEAFRRAYCELSQERRSLSFEMLSLIIKNKYLDSYELKNYVNWIYSPYVRKEDVRLNFNLPEEINVTERNLFPIKTLKKTLSETVLDDNNLVFSNLKILPTGQYLSRMYYTGVSIFLDKENSLVLSAKEIGLTFKIAELYVDKAINSRTAIYSYIQSSSNSAELKNDFQNFLQLFDEKLKNSSSHLNFFLIEENPYRKRIFDEKDYKYLFFNRGLIHLSKKWNIKLPDSVVKMHKLIEEKLASHFFEKKKNPQMKTFSENHLNF